MRSPIKVLLPTGTRADFPRIEPVIESLINRVGVDLLIAVTGLHVLESHGYTADYLEAKYSDHVCKFAMFDNPPDDSPEGVVRAFSRCVQNFAEIVSSFAPDVCLITVDRVETLAFASVCSLMNVPILHVQGGERSGTIDENIRHAVTKLAHIHCAANMDAANRIIQMGENPSNVFDTGCPYSQKLIAARSLDQKQRSVVVDEFLSSMEIARPFSIFCMHPVTTDKDNFGVGNLDIEAIIERMERFGDVIAISPNSDLGFSKILSSISDGRSHTVVVKNINPEIYLSLLGSAQLLVGNSSSGIREACYFGLKVVNIGSRQRGRLAGANVKDVTAQTSEVIRAIDAWMLQTDPLHYADLYGDANGANKIADILVGTDWHSIDLAKEFCDLEEFE